MKLNPTQIGRLLAQRERMREWTQREFDLTLDHVAEMLPEWKEHPYLPDFLSHWHSKHAGDLPDDWFEVMTDKCRRAFASLVGPTCNDARALSIAECRVALGGPNKDLSDAEVRFLRDQLYVLAQIVVDGSRSDKK